MADESGGEEILYPRHPISIDDRKRVEGFATYPEDPEGPIGGHILESDLVAGPMADAASPPSAFTASNNRPRKRTSDEFEMDHAGEPTVDLPKQLPIDERTPVVFILCLDGLESTLSLSATCSQSQSEH